MIPSPSPSAETNSRRNPNSNENQMKPNQYNRALDLFAIAASQFHSGNVKAASKTITQAFKSADVHVAASAILDHNQRAYKVSSSKRPVRADLNSDQGLADDIGVDTNPTGELQRLVPETNLIAAEGDEEIVLTEDDLAPAEPKPVAANRIAASAKARYFGRPAK